ENVLPNTYMFFKKGTIFTNCYSNGGWTLPSAPSIFTGKHISNHKIYHQDYPHDISKNNTLISEKYSAEDYLTFQVAGNWRMTPNYGYVKGFDRTIYKKAIGVQEVIMNFFEHMRAFSTRNHYIWLSIFDLHHFINGLPDISNQVKNSLTAHDYNIDNSKKSPFHDYDKNKIERYVNEIKRIDYYLSILYNYIEENYNKSEILVCLCSDHGKGFLSPENGTLIDSRAKVPFMIRGKNIPTIGSEELLSNIDIYPILLNKSGISVNKVDGKIPKVLGGEKERDYVYSESIYPGQTYKAVIRDKTSKFTFQSEGKVKNDGRFSLGNFMYQLLDSASGEEQTNKQKIKKYTELVLEHIKEMVII
ncbi:MAG: sulfatase-like hydrolase/transferase, partial [Halanaerobiales bacterium]